MPPLTEKNLARAVGKDRVSPGEIVVIEPDGVLSHDNSAAIAEIYARLPHKRVKHPECLAITLDHATPPPTPKHALHPARIRQFVREQGIDNFYEVGRGICQQVLCEEGVISPRMTLLRAASRRDSYRHDRAGHRRAQRNYAHGLGIQLADDALRQVTAQVKSLNDTRQISVDDVDRMLGEAVPAD